MNEFGFLKKKKNIRASKRKMLLLSVFLLAFFLLANYILKTGILDVATGTLNLESDNLIADKRKLELLNNRKKDLIEEYNGKFGEINSAYADMRNLNNIVIDNFFRFARIVSLYITGDLGLLSVVYDRKTMEIKGAAEKRKSITTFSENIKSSRKGFKAIVKDERIDPRGLIFFSLELNENE